MNHVFQTTHAVFASAIYKLDRDNPDTQTGSATQDINFSADSGYDVGRYKTAVVLERPFICTPRESLFVLGISSGTAVSSLPTTTFYRVFREFVSDTFINPISDTITIRIRALTSIPDTITWNSVSSDQTLVERDILTLYLSDWVDATDRILYFGSFYCPTFRISTEVNTAIHGFIIDAKNTNTSIVNTGADQASLEPIDVSTSIRAASASTHVITREG